MFFRCVLLYWLAVIHLLADSQFVNGFDTKLVIEPDEIFNNPLRKNRMSVYLFHIGGSQLWSMECYGFNLFDKFYPGH